MEEILQLLSHLTNLRRTIQFTMEIESEGAIPFLDVLVISKEKHQPLKSAENPPTLADISFSVLTICLM
jgi:hypothetical protein